MSRRPPFIKKASFAVALDVEIPGAQKMDWVSTPVPEKRTLYPYQVTHDPIADERSGIDAWFSLQRIAQWSVC